MDVVEPIVLSIIIATLAISLISWIGILALFLSDTFLDKALMPLISFSAGSLLATSFLHLLPEAINQGGNNPYTYIWLLIGFTLFFLAEQLFHIIKDQGLSKEGDNKKSLDETTNQDRFSEKSSVSYLILVADSIHKFIGGLAIGSSFLISINVGIVTTIAAASHEIPQEVGDFGILVHGGWKKSNALLVNFLSALSIIPGGLVAYYLSTSLNSTLLLSFAAGNFLYIAASNLVPEITHGREERMTRNQEEEPRDIKQSIMYLFLFITGISFISVTRLIFHS